MGIREFVAVTVRHNNNSTFRLQEQMNEFVTLTMREMVKDEKKTNGAPWSLILLVIGRLHGE